jgi:regulator of RNase E activity RraB
MSEVSVSALDELDPETRSVVSDVLDRRDPDLLAVLTSAADLSTDERERVEKCLIREFLAYPFGPDDEPGEDAKRVDDAIGTSLLRFPFRRGA